MPRCGFKILWNLDGLLSKVMPFLVIKLGGNKFLERCPCLKGLSDPLTLQLIPGFPTESRKVLVVSNLWNPRNHQHHKNNNSWVLLTTGKGSMLPPSSMCTKKKGGGKQIIPHLWSRSEPFGEFEPHDLNFHHWCYQASQGECAITHSVQKKSHKTYSWLEYGGRNIIPAHSEALFIRRGFLSLASLCFRFDVILK